jgi:hypothetical protein
VGFKFNKEKNGRTMEVCQSFISKLSASLTLGKASPLTRCRATPLIFHALKRLEVLPLQIIKASEEILGVVEGTLTMHKVSQDISFFKMPCVISPSPPHP